MVRLASPGHMVRLASPAMHVMPDLYHTVDITNAGLLLVSLFSVIPHSDALCVICDVALLHLFSFSF